jgi:hypothetical protein
VIVDDVSMPADLQGFRAGDLVTSIGQSPTPNLTAFVRAADQVRAAPDEVRSGELPVQRLVRPGCSSTYGQRRDRHHDAPGARASSYQAHERHHIGTTGSLLMDQATPVMRRPPSGGKHPTPPRSRSSTCHKVVPTILPTSCFVQTRE